MGSETSYMTSEGLGEMFEGDSADMCAGKFPLVSMGGRAEGVPCADPGARTKLSKSNAYDLYAKKTFDKTNNSIYEVSLERSM